MAIARKEELTQPEYWDTQWSRLRADRRYVSLQWVHGNYVYASLDRLLRSVLRADRTKTFIELGSGLGRWLIYFHKRFGYQVSGCDYSAGGCALARQNLIEAGVEGTIIQQSFFEISGQYDVVFSGGVIEHFDDPKSTLQRFSRLVRPGGILITDVPNLWGLNGLYRLILKAETFHTHRVIRLTELRQWHRELGLRELLGACYGSVCLSRVPPDAFSRIPWVQRLIWTPLLNGVSTAVNRGCLTFHQLALRIEHPLISPHLLVLAQRPERNE